MSNLSLFRYVLFIISLPIVAQTSIESLNIHLQQMQKLFLDEEYLCYSEFMHERVHEINGGLERTQEISSDGMQQLKDEGFKFLDAEYKNPSEVIAFGDELQLTLTFEVLMNTPKGRVVAEYCMIGVSKDQGKSWRFIDTSGRDKEVVLKFFGNLSPDLKIFKTRETKVE